MNLISPFMTDGTKTPYKLKQTCIFQLLDCVRVYNVLLLYGMKVLKGKTIHKINGLIRNIQNFSGTGASTCYNAFQAVYLFCAFLYKTYDTVFMFEIFHLRINVGLKASLALMDVSIFILQRSDSKYPGKESIICSGVYFQHR